MRVFSLVFFLFFINFGILLIPRQAYAIGVDEHWCYCGGRQQVTHSCSGTAPEQYFSAAQVGTFIGQQLLLQHLDQKTLCSVLCKDSYRDLFCTTTKYDSQFPGYWCIAGTCQSAYKYCYDACSAVSNGY